MKYDKIDKYLANKLYETRVVKRITQEDMTKNISAILKANGFKGIERTTYSHYECGIRSMPLEVLQASCKYLGLDWQTIFNEALEDAKIIK